MEELDGLNLEELGLSEKELDIIKNLIEATKKKKSAKRSQPKPSKLPPAYINRYETQCSTCGKIYFESYYMEPDKELGGLMGIQIPEDKVDSYCDVRTSIKTVIICKYCKERLLLLSKEELIDRYLKEKLRWT